MNLDDLYDFQLIANHGSLGKASRATGRSKATLSRRLQEFEEQLGVRLVERGSRNLELTEVGKVLLSQTVGPLREIEDALTAAREGQSFPRGRLRVATPLLFSQVALGRLLAEFTILHPAVQVEAISEDRISDLIDDHFDVAIRINPKEDSGLVGKCFAKDRLILVAAPTVPIPNRKLGKATTIPAVVMPTYREGDIWTVRGEELAYEPQPVLKLSSLLAIRDAVVCGVGVAMLPQSIVSEQLAQRKLVSWGVSGRETELWVLHTSRRLQSPKVKAFVDFIGKQYPTGWFVF